MYVRMFVCMYVSLSVCVNLLFQAAPPITQTNI